MSSIVFGTVEDFNHPGPFLDALHPMDERWENSPPGYWLFRGHWDSSWQLVPSLYRRASVDPFLTWEWNFDSYVAPGSRSVAEMEGYILQRALDEFDASGLAIPDAVTVRRFLADTDLEEMEDELIPFVALAQHHGVPTRLLDWMSTGSQKRGYLSEAG